MLIIKNYILLTTGNNDFDFKPSITHSKVTIGRFVTNQFPTFPDRKKYPVE